MEIVYLFLAGIAGVILQCMIKLNSLCTDASKANVDFGFKDYIKKDWFGILASFIMVVVWLLLFSEVSLQYPKLLNFIRCSFFGMGLMGSYLIQTIFSKGKAYIRDIMDEKSNISDNKTQALAKDQDFIGNRPNDR